MRANRTYVGILIVLFAVSMGYAFARMEGWA